MNMTNRDDKTTRLDGYSWELSTMGMDTRMALIIAEMGIEPQFIKWDRIHIYKFT